MKRSVKAMLGISTTVLAALALASVVPAQAEQPARPSLTRVDVAAMTPEEQAELLTPIRAAANASKVVGRSAAADEVYAGVALDVVAGAVDVFLTDVGQSEVFLSAVKAEDGAVDTSLIRFKGAKNTRKSLDTARTKLWDSAEELGLKIYKISIPNDGNSLEVYAKNSNQIRERAANGSLRMNGKALEEEMGAPLAFQEGEEIVALSRRRDSVPWLGGAAIGPTKNPKDNGVWCTSGIPAQRKSDGRSFIITAAHCGVKGNSFYTEWENNDRTFMGQVEGHVPSWDALAINTGSHSGRAIGMIWDGDATTPDTRVINSYAYSGDGDSVCQNGMVTAGYLHNAKCGIIVTDDDTTWRADGMSAVARGVEGEAPNNTMAAYQGDSGGSVFTITGKTRQSRGIVSAGTLTGKLYWTESTDILNQWNMRLATPPSSFAEAGKK